MTNEEREACMARLARGFMVPNVARFDRAQKTDGPQGGQVYPDGGAPDVGETDAFGAEVWEREEAPGFYARLSAPGYMDCTDWSGPYATEAEAEEYLVKTHDDGDDE